MDVDIRPVGDSSVLAVVSDTIDMATVERVWSLAQRIGEVVRRGVLDVVPAYASVLVRFDPRVTDLARVMSGIRGAASAAGQALRGPRRRWTIGVCFGGEYGIDFERAAHDLGMREARLRDTFCKAPYSVAFVGFLAGFPYLLGLPPALCLARLQAPRPRVPAGSVAVASGQCGIYPRQSPGGWHLLGRTQVPLFDPMRDRPALFLPGDSVRFTPVERFEETAHASVEFAT